MTRRPNVTQGALAVLNERLQRRGLLGRRALRLLRGKGDPLLVPDRPRPEDVRFESEAGDPLLVIDPAVARRLAGLTLRTAEGADDLLELAHSGEAGAEPAPALRPDAAARDDGPGHVRLRRTERPGGERTARVVLRTRLTRTQLAVVRELVAAGEVPRTELRRRARVRFGIERILRGLERRGLLERGRADGDAAEELLRATAAAEDLLLGSPHHPEARAVSVTDPPA